MHRRRSLLAVPVVALTALALTVPADAKPPPTLEDTHNQQFTFRRGNSEPTGSGTNFAGLGIFEYQTRCGTVYGHTGNTSGYTEFIAASADGSRSTSVSVNAQITPKVNKRLFGRLRNIFQLAVCAATA
jgi:D-alanyl-D-alanine carboxypeptidase